MAECYLGYPPPRMREWIKQFIKGSETPERGSIFTYDERDYITGFGDGAFDWSKSSYDSVEAWRAAKPEEPYSFEYESEEFFAAMEVYDEWCEAGAVALDTSRMIDIVDEKARGVADEFWEQPFGIPYQLKSFSMPNLVELNWFEFGGFTDEDGNLMGDLTSVSIPSVKIIYEYAFAYSPKLVSVDVGSAIYVGRNAFAGDEKLESIDLPNAVSLGMKLTYDDDGSIMYDGELPVLDTNADDEECGLAFHHCTALTSVNVPKVKYVAHHTFAGCTALTELRLPSAEYIGKLAFDCCTSLTALYLPHELYIQAENQVGCTATWSDRHGTEWLAQPFADTWCIPQGCEVYDIQSGEFFTAGYTGTPN